MTFYYTLVNERKHLENKIINIKKILETLPKENLRCARNKNSYKWYSYSDNSRKYIYKKDRAYAEQLALKKYYLLALEDYTKELKAINSKKAQHLLHASRILVHIFYTVLFLLFKYP